MKRVLSLARLLAARALGRADHRTVFEWIYLRNVWQNPESASGPGSTRTRGAAISPTIIALLRDLRVSTLVDAPCGDANWIDEIADSVESYIGVDVVPELIERNQRLHPGPNRTYLSRDLTTDPLPSGDLVLCRDCLVHFSTADVWRAVANLRASGTPLLLTTTFLDRDANPEIVTGGWRPLNLQAPPFGFPEPLALADEQCLHTGGIYRDKRLALWRLAELPLAGPR